MRTTHKLLSTVLAIEMAFISAFPTGIHGDAMIDPEPIEIRVAESSMMSAVEAEPEIYISQGQEVTVEEIEEKVASIEYDQQLLNDIDLIALVTIAEAEGESEYGKRLVIDTILNRVDHSAFPDTVSGVIYQSGQFEAMWNGRVNRCYVQEDIVRLVKEEIESRTNYDVMFFVAGGYSAYGTPLLAEGNHYFSSY